MPAPKILTSLSRAVRWHRRKLAAVCAAGAVLAGLSAIAPPAPPTAWVVVTSRQLAGGTRLAEGDLQRVQRPIQALPEDAVAETETLVGRVLVGPLPANTMLSGLSVVSSRLAGTTPGLMIVPVRLGESDLRALLQPGDRIDLIALSDRGGPATVVAKSVRIAAIPASESGGGFGGSSDSRGLLILIEADAQTATRVTDAAVTSKLGVAMR